MPTPADGAAPDFEVDMAFLEDERLPMSLYDIRYGFDHGWLTPETVIDWATRELTQGDDDPIVVRLGCLLRDEAGEVGEVLCQLESPEHIHDPRDSARLWLYVQLKAAYVSRTEFDDPLEIVELIHAAFDYPSTIARFVRHAALRPGDELGIKGLMDRWAQFLSREHIALTNRFRDPPSAEC